MQWMRSDYNAVEKVCVCHLYHVCFCGVRGVNAMDEIISDYLVEAASLLQSAGTDSVQ